MTPFNRFRKLVLAIATLGVLGGCAATEKVTGLFSDPIILACPDYWVLAEAANLVRYVDGGGRDLTDVDVEGQIDNMSIGCLTKIDEKTMTGTMDVEVIFNFIASRGPANTSKKAIYPYFISLTDLDKNVLQRKKYEVAVDFSGNRTKFNFRNQANVLTLDINPELTGKDYLIYGGFILTREQLQENRIRRKQRTN